ncbi:MAG TPA: hypothetical protein VK776_27570 [Bryobacteraceae bacterium]|nr:hypothetical protein [Bryobacteraceae bacterium]
MKHIQSIVFITVCLAATQYLEAQTVFNPFPSRIVGQAVLQQQAITATAINLVEGREFQQPQAVALDTSASPPILYVVDAGNNRVLAWKNASGFTKGAPMADLVIGQRDLLSTAPQGPGVNGSNLITGLFQPVALTVDSSGNLYVVDAGNNRILRYPTPFSQTGSLLPVDLILGQINYNGSSVNQGQTAPSATTLALASNSGALRAGLAFDAQGNLWVSDPGNNRVLRYPASTLASGAANDPAADLVLGHSDFATVSLPTTLDPTQKNYLLQPAGLAFDPKGRLFVVDDADRVMVYVPPFANGQLASRIMGVVPPTQQQPTPPAISASTLGFVDSNGSHPPQGVFFVGSNPYVADTGYSRILGYAPFDQWAPETTAFSPPANVVIGQPNFVSGRPNNNQAKPDATTLNQPVTGTFAGTDLFVADSFNNRVLVFPQQTGGTFGSASRLLGQDDFIYNSINLIEGREFGFVTGGSAVIDVNSNPPHLYVSDPLNNRVLGFMDYRKVNAGTTADLVIGQPDFFTALINWPANNVTQANNQGLYSPEGLAVDSNSNLYVADGGNARVLRFPAPFAQTPTGAPPQANLVLGQPSFYGQPIKDLSQSTLSSSFGLAFTNEGGLLVSDVGSNRVLFFKKPAGGDFQSGVPANNVIGQTDFNSGLKTTLNGPRGITIDADDQLYVADTGNNRIAIFPNVPVSGNNPPLLFSITGLSTPYDVFVDLNTDGIWVTDTNNNQVLRYPKYSTVINNPAPNGVINPVFGPVSVAVDPFSNPVIAEANVNRVSFFYPAIDYTSSAGGVPQRLSGNAANYFQRFAPGMLSSIFAFPGQSFGSQTVVNSSIPVPTTLGGVQVTVAGIPAPLLYVSPSQINFQVPGATPVGGPQEIQVLVASTGQVIASWLFRIDTVSPGLFTANATGSGPVLAINQDGSINDGSHPAKAGTYISLYATGQGAVNGMPPDGQPAPSSTLITAPLPLVFINATQVATTDIQFSGLAPNYVGLWQINAKVPANVPPGAVSVFIEADGIPSALDATGTIRRLTTINVTP